MSFQAKVVLGLSALVAVLVFLCLLLVSVINVSLAFAVASSVFLVSALLFWVVLNRLFFRPIQRASSFLQARVQQEFSPQSSQNPVLYLACRMEEVLAAQGEELERLRKSEAFRAEFVADVSHELKTPLFAAQGFVDTLIDGAVDDAGVRMKFLQHAAKSLEELGTLVRDLLTLSQIETGYIRMKLERIDLYTLCLEVVEGFRQRGLKHRISVQSFPVGEHPIVQADGFRIMQVVKNLLSNAVQYTDQNGSIDIRIEVLADGVFISIADTGIGIPAEDLDRIFRRFYRVDKSRSKDHGGTGLGLAIVKHILEQHGAKIHVSSQLGRGSTFSFILRRLVPS